MDNLFTSGKLLTELRSMGISGAGTVRTLKTDEEEKEERSSVQNLEVSIPAYF
jgi:hypothetical protein